MTGLLLSVHVIAAILAIGPVAVATSMFPPALGAHQAMPHDTRTAGTLLVLARITRVYSAVGLVVPAFGLATGASLGVLGDPWLIASIVLTCAAAVILAVLILPAQERALASVRPVSRRTVPASAVPVATPAEAGPADSDPGGAVSASAVPADADRADAGELEIGRASTALLAMRAGIFNLLWAIVVVLMIYRPGSTTGAGG
ncbi:hypothetical protein Ga0074812_106314 [Parafrankia irregularis]|uniref:Uncharacterized protein n=1 Tax=Parafrankia irregularis TaxID=795642 RepID=A0A0S4QKB4_9ACTN|nr:MULTISPECIES: hypothetical protein [Parafrankia]MBE3202306.1 protease [Parafrankia sp. CH37]CUU56059.1 hypothetical protein Ga0074812_106314 [Parafrankia irregularis]